MSLVKDEARGVTGPLAPLSHYVSRIALRLVGLAIVDAFALWLLYLLIRDGVWPLAITIAVVTLGVNVINLHERIYPIRWMSPALAIIVLMVLYPILFTVYTAFTNYSDGHLLTKTQTIHLLAKEQYLPEGGTVYGWTAFRSPEGEYIFWLVGEDGQTYLAHPGEPIEEAAPGEAGTGPLDDSGVPESIEGYQRLGMVEVLPILDTVLGELEFGEPPLTIKIKSMKEAAQLQQRYVYDEDQDAIMDQAAGMLYYADEKAGFFTSKDGTTLYPGYQVTVGWANFQRFLSSPALRGPFIQVFLWTIAFSFLSVLSTFAMGLFLALIFNDPLMPVRKLFRSMLILPYTIPGVIGILMWRGMLNEHLGVISTNMVSYFGWAPAWFTDPWWSKVGILLVNLWLGYPYMMLLCSGALQAIPPDVYEAAEVDGAGAWQRFWNITLPLLLVGVGPLLIASFTFNFNNFTVIYAYNRGRPPIPGTPTPAGYTDILITYTYRLAFESGRGSDYAYAAAITIVIFLIVASVTLFQYRFTRQWEEVSESV